MRKHKGKGPSSNQRLANGNQKEGSCGERSVTEKATKRTNRASVLFLVKWNMVRFAPLRRALQRDTSQHGILASAACKVAPHVALVLMASPGLQDLVLIDRAQFPKSDGPKLRLFDGEVLQKLA